MPERAQDSFARVLVEDNTKVQSTCVRCGFVILASVIDGIEAQELDHSADCPKTWRTFPAAWGQ